MNLLPVCHRARVIGGLLGAAGGEGWHGARGGFEDGGPVTAAMRDLCRAYTDPGVTPAEVARAHEGVPAPGWLLPVALANRSRRDLVSDTLELALAGGVTSAALRSCVTYVELAWELLAEQTVSAAVGAVTGEALPPPVAGPPSLCGMAPVDAVTTSLWALAQPGRLCDLVASLAEWTEPWVAAAVAGLLGVRDGCAAIPAQWRADVPAVPDLWDLGRLLTARSEAGGCALACLAVVS